MASGLDVDMMGGLRPRSSGNIPVSTCGGAQLYWEEYGPCDSGSSSAGALSPAAAPSTVGFPAGPPAYDKRLLLINGANGKIPFLGHAIQRFVRLGYTVLVHEARGVGRSSAVGPPARQSTRLLAADAQAVADGVWGAHSRFRLLGASLGGMVAQELVYRLVRGGDKPKGSWPHAPRRAGAWQAYGVAAHRGDLCTLACLTRLGCPLPPPAAPAPAAAPVAGAGAGPAEAAEAFWSAFLHGGGDHHGDGSRPAGSDQAEGAGSGVLTGDTAGWQLAALKALVEAERGGGSFYIRRQPAPSEPPTDPACQIPAILQNQQQPAAQAVLFRRLQTEPRRQLRQLHSLQREQVQPLPEPVKWQRSVSLHRDGVAAGAGAAAAYGDGRLGQCHSTAVLAAAAAAAGGVQAAAAAAALPGAKEAFGCPLVAVAAGGTEARRQRAAGCPAAGDGLRAALAAAALAPGGAGAAAGAAAAGVQGGRRRCGLPRALQPSD